MKGKILKYIESNGVRCWLFKHIDKNGGSCNYTVVQVEGASPEICDVYGTCYNRICEVVQVPNFSLIDIAATMAVSVIGMRATRTGAWILDNVLSDFYEVTGIEPDKTLKDKPNA